MIRGNCKLALDIGGSSVKYGLIQDDIVTFYNELPVLSTDNAAGIIGGFQSAIHLCKAEAQQRQLSISSLGVSVPGPFDYINGISLMKHKYTAIYGMPLRRFLVEPLGDIPLRFVSDAGAFLLGAIEVLKIASNRVCGITIGTGIGFAGVIDGKLQCNTEGGPMLTLFSMPYLNGCTEDYVSRRALEKRYADSGGSCISVRGMAMRARCNEQIAKALFERVGTDIVRIMSPIMEQHRFSCLVIGGQIGKAFDLMYPAMDREMQQKGENFTILPAGEIMQAALLGAAKISLEEQR